MLGRLNWVSSRCGVVARAGQIGGLEIDVRVEDEDALVDVASFFKQRGLIGLSPSVRCGDRHGSQD